MKQSWSWIFFERHHFRDNILILLYPIISKMEMGIQKKKKKKSWQRKWSKKVCPFPALDTKVEYYLQSTVLPTVGQCNPLVTLTHIRFRTLQSPAIGMGQFNVMVMFIMQFMHACHVLIIIMHEQNFVTRKPYQSNILHPIHQKIVR